VFHGLVKVECCVTFEYHTMQSTSMLHKTIQNGDRFCVQTLHSAKRLTYPRFFKVQNIFSMLSMNITRYKYLCLIFSFYSNQTVLQWNSVSVTSFQ